MYSNLSKHVSRFPTQKKNLNLLPGVSFFGGWSYPSGDTPQINRFCRLVSTWLDRNHQMIFQQRWTFSPKPIMVVPGKLPYINERTLIFGGTHPCFFLNHDYGWKGRSSLITIVRFVKYFQLMRLHFSHPVGVIPWMTDFDSLKSTNLPTHVMFKTGDSLETLLRRFQQRIVLPSKFSP